MQKLREKLDVANVGSRLYQKKEINTSTEEQSINVTNQITPANKSQISLLPPKGRSSSVSESKTVDCVTKRNLSASRTLRSNAPINSDVNKVEPIDEKSEEERLKKMKEKKEQIERIAKRQEEYLKNIQDRKQKEIEKEEAEKKRQEKVIQTLINFQIKATLKEKAKEILKVRDEDNSDCGSDDNAEDGNQGEKPKNDFLKRNQAPK